MFSCRRGLWERVKRHLSPRFMCGGPKKQGIRWGVERAEGCVLLPPRLAGACEAASAIALYMWRPEKAGYPPTKTRAFARVPLKLYPQIQTIYHQNTSISARYNRECPACKTGPCSPNLKSLMFQVGHLATMLRKVGYKNFPKRG